jgi:transcriptional regulator with XRE-family HTH domain
MTGSGYWQHAMFLFMSAPSHADPALAATLRRLRTERGDTQEDLAHRAGLTVAALARIERGHANPTWTNVRRIAAALDIGLAALGEAVECAQLPS